MSCCPKCQSANFIRIPSDKSTCANMLHVRLGIVDMLSFPVTHYVCCGCGYMEQRIEQEEALLQLAKTHSKL